MTAHELDALRFVASHETPVRPIELAAVAGLPPTTGPVPAATVLQCSSAPTLMS
jgi:hypothetical protein